MPALGALHVLTACLHLGRCSAGRGRAAASTPPQALPRCHTSTKGRPKLTGLRTNPMVDVSAMPSLSKASCGGGWGEGYEVGWGRNRGPCAALDAAARACWVAALARTKGVTPSPPPPHPLTISPSCRVVPELLMSISMGRLPPCFSRYSSSATISSVTAGTSCGRTAGGGGVRGFCSGRGGCWCGAAAEDGVSGRSARGWGEARLAAPARPHTHAACRAWRRSVPLRRQLTCVQRIRGAEDGMKNDQNTSTHRHAKVDDALVEQERGQIRRRRSAPVAAASAGEDAHSGAAAGPTLPCAHATARPGPGAAAEAAAAASQRPAASQRHC